MRFVRDARGASFQSDDACRPFDRANIAIKLPVSVCKSHASSFALQTKESVWRQGGTVCSFYGGVCSEYCVSLYLQNGYTTIGTDSSGKASASTSTATGALYTLNANGAVYSSFVGDATCAFVGFSSNDSTVDAFVTTKSNFLSMLTDVSAS